MEGVTPTFILPAPPPPTPLSLRLRLPSMSTPNPFYTRSFSPLTCVITTALLIHHPTRQQHPHLHHCYQPSFRHGHDHQSCFRHRLPDSSTRKGKNKWAESRLVTCYHYSTTRCGRVFVIHRRNDARPTSILGWGNRTPIPVPA
jgi:hypothetical protein